MSKKVVIAHRWSGSSKSDWYPWLGRELEEKGHKVIIPEMGDTDKPTISEWVGNLREAIGEQNEDVYIIAHSISCQTTMRYLSNINRQLGGVVFVAPWFHLKNLEDEETREVAKPWLETSIDLVKVKKQAGKLVCFFSDNDPYVPLSDKDVFAYELGAEVILMKSMGHFTEDDGVKELPSVLEAVEKML